MRRTRTRVDVGRMASAAARPGIDPRVWLTLAVVTELGFDPDEGVFVDVQYQPDGTPETCYLGQPYAGNAFGWHFPVAIGDTVLVAVPLGDPGFGPQIINRFWNAGDPPPNDIEGENDNPTEDVVLRMRPGRKLKIRTKDEDDNKGDISIVLEDDGNMRLETSGDGRIDIEAKGSGKIVIANTGSEKVYIGGEDGTEPIALGTTLKNHLTQVKTWLDTHTHNVPGVMAGPSTATAVPPVSPSPNVPDIEADEGQVK